MFSELWCACLCHSYVPFLLFKGAKWKTNKLLLWEEKPILWLPVFTLDEQGLGNIAEISTNSTVEEGGGVLIWGVSLEGLFASPSSVSPASQPTSPWQENAKVHR